VKTLIAIILFHYLLFAVDSLQADVIWQCTKVTLKGKVFEKCKMVHVIDYDVFCHHYTFTDHMNLTTNENYCTYYYKRTYDA